MDGLIAVNAIPKILFYIYMLIYVSLGVMYIQSIFHTREPWKQLFTEGFLARAPLVWKMIQFEHLDDAYYS
jgi:hypothetical protein